MSAQKAGLNPARTRLRATVATISAEIERLGAGKEGASALAAPWADLVAQLALGPEPEVRACPACQNIGIREATKCGFCWTKLEPTPREAA